MRFDGLGEDHVWGASREGLEVAGRSLRSLLLVAGAAGSVCVEVGDDSFLGGSWFMIGFRELNN